MNGPTDSDVEALYEQLRKDAENAGYHLNPDTQFAKSLVQSLLIIEKKLGYQACPCRLAAEKKDADLDIICPCDYRDSDLSEFGMCFCALYVSQELLDGKKTTGPIPDRRPLTQIRQEMKEQKPSERNASLLSYPIWRCTVCGYLCARNEPPEICPICKAKKERFELFITNK